MVRPVPRQPPKNMNSAAIPSTKRIGLTIAPPAMARINRMIPSISHNISSAPFREPVTGLLPALLRGKTTGAPRGAPITSIAYLPPALAAEQVSERAPDPALASAARRDRDLALGGLDQQPSGAGEADLDGLARSASGDRLDVHVGLDRRRHAARPRDRGLRIGEGLLSVEL